MLLSIAFVFIDIAVTIHQLSKDDGVNPFWKFYVIFKCASDVIFLDDFKKVVDSLLEVSMGRLNIPVDHGRNRCTNKWPMQTQFAERMRTPQSQTSRTPDRGEPHLYRPFGFRRGRAMEHELDPVLTAPFPYANSESESSRGGLELENRA
ncbi:uncharacterized protein PAC_13824 [Phialocephala subalpina]|uniref:Uncharacterized protein n=1 Tax=Phialocephala subalpina TaxID=576137 RepID=A0A1L7XG48_9HELO|nr:uncharacterized protein PAC_13824 [Phialocephala subalpina]